MDDTIIVDAISGTKSDTYITTLSKGTHTITATYSKDSSGKSGNDEGQLTLNDITEITYGCSKDDHVHELITEITKEPTCTETGLETCTCQNCSCVYTKVIAVIEHDYVGVLTKEATETENGEMTYTCSKCGKSYIEMVSLPVKQSFADTSWSDINIISESGLASNYFNVGDEKELQIGSETYHVQILGFDHDDKSDGSGKSGITVGLKEIMTTKKVMNSSGSTVGGWEQSEMRTYLQNDILPTLPSDLKAVIKTVDKVSDTGNPNYTLNTTQDKLFLFSTTEVGGNSWASYDVDDQGTQYKFFTNNASRTKKYLSGSSGSWWLRSASTNYTYGFCYVYNNGSDSDGYPYTTFGVVFGFSI